MSKRVTKLAIRQIGLACVFVSQRVSLLCTVCKIMVKHSFCLLLEMSGLYVIREPNGKVDFMWFGQRLFDFRNLVQADVTSSHGWFG